MDSLNEITIYDVSNYIFNPIMFIFIVLLIIAYYVLFQKTSSSSNSFDNLGSSFTNDLSGSAQSSTYNIFIVLLILLVFIFILYLIDQYFHLGILDFLNIFFNPQSRAAKEEVKKVEEADKKIIADLETGERDLLGMKEVYNIPGNNYTFNEAKAICKAYNGELATVSQLQKAYKNGADWCNYGWSDDKMVLFPTQTNTFNKLQKIKGHENDCGRPGVNGGYIANPNVKFGVNCYGYKPKMTDADEDLMQTLTPYAETQEDLNFQKEVKYWKGKVDDILVSPFNYVSWNQL
jgi:hypothetical protein